MRASLPALTSKALGATVIVALVAFLLWPLLAPRSDRPTRTLVLYGFSILGEAMNEGVLPAFQRSWAAKHGEDVEYITSFAGSGTITNQIILGVPVEVAVLAHELDAIRLARASIVPPLSWRALPHEGVLNRSPFIILVRPGNPKKISEFAHLAHPDITIVHPDPLLSGGALWAVLAEYHSALVAGGTKVDAARQLRRIWDNVRYQASSARGARTQFDQGFGDALITYEQEALRDHARGKLKADVVYPESSILSEHIVVPVWKNVSPEQRPLIEGFLHFLWSSEAQTIFQQYGFRSVDPSVLAEGRFERSIKRPFFIRDLGGWEAAEQEIVEGVWKRRVLRQ